MTFAELLTRFSAAAVAGDGAGFAACFTEDGVYRDVFYGAFRGRERIAFMLEERFHRDGEDFIWDTIDPVASETRGYVRYLFSYRSKLPEAAGRRSVFEGVACCKLRDGLIAEYDEVANAAAGLAMIGFDEARLARFVAKQGEDLRERPGAARHFG